LSHLVVIVVVLVVVVVVMDVMGNEWRGCQSLRMHL